MEYRKLGNTELELSAIAYGAFAIGGHMWGGNEQQDSVDAIRASLDHGVTTIDTAPFYGLGLSEELVAKALQGRDRTKIQLLTKFGLVWDGSNEGKGTYFFDVEDKGRQVAVYKYAAKEQVFREVEDSLRRLRTDYIDLLQLHWPDDTTPVDETMEALLRLQEQGKIRAAGVSNYSVPQLQEAGSSISLAANQVPYSMLNRAIESTLVPYAVAHNLGIIAYSPMERGLLTGKYSEGGILNEKDHRNGYFGQFDREKVKQLLDQLIPIAADKQATLAQLVLRWTSMQKGIAVVLAGARNAEQAIANARAMELRLTPAEMAHIQVALAGFAQ